MNRYKLIIVVFLIILTSCKEQNPSQNYICYLNEDNTYQLRHVGYENMDATNLIIQEKYNDKPITVISGQAFLNCVAESITLPDTVITLCSDSFKGCENLTTIHLGASLQNIQSFAFRGCANLEKITIDTQNPYFYVQNNCLIERETKKLVLGGVNCIIPQDVLSIGDFAFDGRIGLKTITLPDGLQEIGAYAFANTSLTAIEFPQNLKMIDDHAFENTDIQSIKLPDSLTDLGIGAFLSCLSLKSINVGTNIKSNLVSALYACENLDEIVVAEENPVYRVEHGCIILRKNNALLRCTRNAILPDNIYFLETDSLHSSYLNTKKVKIPNSVTMIKELAIRGDFIEIYIPSSVQIVVEGAILLNNNAISKPTIYCEAAEKPDGWHEEWLYCQGEYNVVWGYDFTQVNAPEQQ